MQLDAPLRIDSTNAWAIPVKLRIDVSSNLVPAETEWIVTIADEYPHGSIDVYPALANSIETTFPHQNLNVPREEYPWRGGRLCLDTPLRQLVGDVAAKQPTSATGRLAWHVARAREWLVDAADNRLAKVGDPFESPLFNFDPNEPWVLYAEDAESFKIWSLDAAAGLRKGKAVVSVLRRTMVETVAKAEMSAVVNSIVVERFNVHPRMVSPPWGTRVIEGDKLSAHWLLLPQIPIVRAYETPTTWGDLWRVAKQMDIDLERAMRAITEDIRGGDASQLLLLGFPVPETCGEPAVEIAWQALELPNLPDGKYSKKLRWDMDKANAFGSCKSIHWIRTCNVAESHMSVRGSLPSTLRAATVAIIGVGALGSVVAEILVRMGVNDVVLVDCENLDPGNLRRHLLTMDDVDAPKAAGLARRLNTASFFAMVRGPSGAFPSDAVKAQLADRTVIIDCTATNDVIFALGKEIDETPRRFFSFSTSPDAEKMFAYTSTGTALDPSNFFKRIEDFNRFCVERFDKIPAVRDVGCHNPAFPAPFDGILRLAALAVTFMSRDFSNAPEADIIDAG